MLLIGLVLKRLTTTRQCVTKLLTRKAMYVQRNIETRSPNYCCSGNAVNIRPTCSECVSVTLDIQHAMRMRCIVICGLSDSTVFFHVIS
jgi:hypothetical protein